MSCANSYKNSRYKSAQTAYNNASQTISTAGTQMQILGNLICDTGCSIETTGAGFRILGSGLYRFSYDVTVDPTGAGTMIVQLYNGTTALPCAVVTSTTVASEVETVHVETVIRLNSCCGVQPLINAVISGVDGTVDHVCASAVKLA